MNKARRFWGLVALALGLIGSVLALAAGVTAILFVVRANNVVDDVEERITAPIDRLAAQVEETSTAIEGMDGGELNVRLDGIAEQAISAETAPNAISDHPLYSRLPIDVVSLEDSLRSATDRAGELVQTRADEVSGTDRTQIVGSLDEISETLARADSAVGNTTDSLRFWIRVSGLLFVALSLWGLWGQLLLAREGRRAMRRPSALSSTETKMG